MKKVLFISANQYPKLSVDFNTQKKWHELSQELDEFHVMARSKHNRFEYSQKGKVHLHLVPAIGNKSRSIYFTGWYLFILIKRLKVDLILIQSAILGGLYATWASKIFKIPTMVEIHGEEYFRFLRNEKSFYFPLKHMIRYVYKNADKIRSLNALMTEKLASHGFVKNVVEIPNRVDLNLFKPKKESFEISNPIKIISVGRFVPAKNYYMLIKLLAKTNIDYHLTLVGGGPEKDSYIELIEQYHLQDKVKLIDWVKQEVLIQDIIQSDLYIQYSQSEGMPRSILEAMALQMPILTTAVGSIGGVIDHDKNGLIFGLNDIKNLEESLQKVISNATFRSGIAKNAYRDVLTKYEWKHAFDIYRRVLRPFFLDVSKENKK